jgi:Flp pilus assembly protein TadG
MKRNSEAGQTLIAVALMLVVLLGALGLAIDMGYLRYMKRQLQTAADAAAIAGALEINSCGGSSGCSNLIDAAQKASGENGFTDGTRGVTVAVNNPPTTAGDPHSGDAHYVEVIVSQPEPSHFANVFGVSSTTLSARGEARMTSGNCVYTLNDLDTHASGLTSQCGLVVEGDLDCDSGGSITAPRIAIGTSGSLSLRCATNPSPVHIPTPTPRDPLARLTKPSVSPCGTSTSDPYTGSPGPLDFKTGSNVTLNPGVYCGGIIIEAGANVTFAGATTGAFVLTSTSGSNGGLTVTGGTLAGSSVTIYNYGPRGAINFNSGSANLAAPTSGAYEGVLFFQDANDTNDPTFAVASTFTGAYYFPNADLSFAVDLGARAAYTILVAQHIGFTGTTFTIKNDYSSLSDGSPITDSAVLVE